MDVMLDLETMGTGNKAAIISIGAVAFNIDDPIPMKFAREFYVTVDLASSVKAGMEIDAATVLWWMKQSQGAKRDLTDGQSILLPDALTMFRGWFLNEALGRTIWGNGSIFDCTIMTAGYRLCQLPEPYNFRQVRDVRTMLALTPTVKVADFQIGTEHNALDDARAQARAVIQSHRILKGLDGKVNATRLA